MVGLNERKVRDTIIQEVSQFFLEVKTEVVGHYNGKRILADLAIKAMTPNGPRWFVVEVKDPALWGHNYSTNVRHRAVKQVIEYTYFHWKGIGLAPVFLAPNLFRDDGKDNTFREDTAQFLSYMGIGYLTKLHNDYWVLIRGNELLWSQQDAQSGLPLFQLVRL